MDQMMEEILGYLRHDKLEVRKQAVSAIFQYSNNSEVIEFIKKSDMMKALKACLYDINLVHSALLVMLNLSAEKSMVLKMEEHQIMDSLLQIIFNVMKTMNKEDLTLKKHLMVEVGGTKIGPDGGLIREMQVNTGEKISEEEIVTVLNIENLRLSLLIINNMCSLSPSAKRQFLQLDADEKTKGTHFIVLLGWFLIDDYELLFENFASLLNTLTDDDDLKEFLLSPAIRLETRIKRYLIHSNNQIRGSILLCMKHLFFSHENVHLTERFCEFKPDEVHIIELTSRCIYLALQEKYMIKEDHKKIMEKYLGSIWKPIKTLKKQNPRIQTVDEELENALEVLLVSTNFEFADHIKGELADFEQVKQLKKVLSLFADYAKEAFFRDKITGIMSIYTGDIIL
jgi:hypothetical protein